jgi:hypothetical protein
MLTQVMISNAYNILAYLGENDIENLRRTSKFFYDICECHAVFEGSIKGLNKLFSSSVENTDFFKKQTFFDDSRMLSTGQSFASNATWTSEKKSKFKEKFNFNKPINDYYTESDNYKQRLQSARSINSAKKK